MNNRSGKSLLILLMLAFMVGFSGCSDSTSSAKEEIQNPLVFFPDSLHDDLIFVKATGHKTSLGTNDSSANLRERPRMEVNFQYDFAIGIHEVTKGEFARVMDTKVSKDEEDEPAVNVTFGDAILYANKRSISEGLDSAYSYSSVTYDAEEHVLLLENFGFNPGANGYRLPTEAEWVLAASQGWNPDSSWNSENSDYKVHDVCTAGKNSLGLCDMAGNVAEWVNDWMGYFRDTSLTNFTGAVDGGSQGERILKGGSFRNSSSAMSLSGRTDVYTVTSSTKAAYVGFRVALGAIPNVSWLNSDGSACESPVNVIATNTLVKAMTGNYNTKLVFRNDVTGNLEFVEFINSNPVVNEIVDTIDAFHPDISPDGSKVAFCTKMEGVEGKSSLYVRNLDAEGTHLVKLDVESAAIPRWRVSAGGDTSIVYVTNAGTNQTDETWKSYSTWEVSFSNGKFGTPKKLLDGSFHGGISADNRLAVTGARLLRARSSSDDIFSKDAKDSLWYNGEQACNVSLTQDSSKKTLFLDFAGKTGEEFVGESYKTHGRLLIADSTGKLMESIKAPAGYTFDHSEWVIHNSNSIVVSLTNANGSHEKIALVDVPTGIILDLVLGEELWHPCVWVRQSSGQISADGLDLDSAGVYLVPGSEWFQEAVRVKMELFWTTREELNVIGVGSSRMEDGFIPNEITSGYAVNMGHSSNNFVSSLRIAENYALNHAPNLKAIVLDVGFDLWYDSTSYADILFNGAPGFIYDKNHGYWKDSLPKNFVTAVKESYPATSLAQTTYIPSRGYLKNDVAYGWGEAAVEVDSNWTKTEPEMVSWHKKKMENFLKVAQEKKMNVVGVLFPINPGYKNTGAWGRYGVRRSDADSILAFLQDLEKTYSNFILFDENKNGDHDYDDDMALNTDHLVYKGASQFTRRLDSLLMKLD